MIDWIKNLVRCKHAFQYFSWQNYEGDRMTYKTYCPNCEYTKIECVKIEKTINNDIDSDGSPYVTYGS